MKNIFLNKYQDYCRTRDLKDEIFNMSARDNETLEEYVEIFQYNLQRSPYTMLSKDVLKAIMLKGMKEEWVEMLNIIGKGDSYQEEYDEIISLCIRCSQGTTCNRPVGHDSMKKYLKQTNGNVTREEFGNLLENFKTNILGTLTT